ncbi:30240_t:CDS:1, partial [Racocetra persica]
REHNSHLVFNIIDRDCPKIIDTISQFLSQLIEKCWNKNLLQRPNTTRIVKFLKNILKRIQSKELCIPKAKILFLLIEEKYFKSMY